MKTATRVLAFSGALLMTAASSRATLVDLSGATTEGSIVADVGGTAWFTRYHAGPAGTGNIDPFLRLEQESSGKGSLGDKYIEEAYNTDGRTGSGGGAQAPLDAKSDPNYTRSLILGGLEQVLIEFDGVSSYYYVFALDSNEPNATDKELLSIDNIRIYTAPAADGGDSITTAIDTLGTLRFALNQPNYVDPDLPGDEPENYVVINSTPASGSGDYDMFAYIPVSAFVGAAATDYVYFYNLNGVHYAADDFDGLAAESGFEEWSARMGTTTIPDGGVSAVLLGVALLGMGGLQRMLRR